MQNKKQIMNYKQSEIYSPSRSTNQAFFLDVLNRLPPEAIISIVKTVGDLLKKSQEDIKFEKQLKMIREKNLDRIERLNLLIELLFHKELNEDLQLKLIDSICKIAEG